MIASIMIYGMLISMLTGLGAVVIERGFVARRWPRRGIWIVAIATSLGLPALMILGASKPALLSESRELIQTRPALTVTASSSASVVAAAASTEYGAKIPTAQEPRFRLKLQWPYLPEFDTQLKNFWIAMSACLLVTYIGGWIRLRRSSRCWSSTMIEGEVVRVAEHMGPAVFGFVHPVIVVPRWLLDASRSTQQIVIAHERSHIDARDPLVLLFALLSIAVTPWNLLLWWQLRQLRFALEVDCDARVLRCNIDVSAYGETLISIGQHSSRTPIGAIALIEPASQLERRIRTMTRETYRYGALLTATSIALCASLVVTAAQIETPALGANLATSSPSIDSSASTSNNREPPTAASLHLSSNDSHASDTSAPAKQNIARSSLQASKQATIKASIKRIDSVAARYTFNFQNKNVLAVLDQLRSISGQDFVVSPSVQGAITLRLKSITWEEGLDAVLRAKDLDMRKQGNVMIIGTVAEISARDAAMLAWRQEVADLAPLQNEYITLKYARALAVAATIKATSISGRGSVSVDEPTNTLVLQDTPNQLTSIRQLIAALDVPAQPTQPSSPN